MPTLKTIVVDDEPLALQLICDYVLKTTSLQLIQYTTNPIDALQYLSENNVDLVFLDIQMPELGGINFLKLMKQKTKAILMTAYQDYALEGYEHDVIDYLLKPVTYERFLAAVQKAQQRIASSVKGEEPSYFFVKTEYKIQKIDYADILYLEGLRDYVAIHTTQGKILSLQPMRLFEEKLPPKEFIRIHKSYMIAVHKINYIEKSRVVIHNQFLPIGDNYREKLLKKINAM